MRSSGPAESQPTKSVLPIEKLLQTVERTFSESNLAGASIPLAFIEAERPGIPAEGVESNAGEAEAAGARLREPHQHSTDPLAFRGGSDHQPMDDRRLSPVCPGDFAVFGILVVVQDYVSQNLSVRGS